MNEISRTPEYNIFWEDDNELEYEEWITRAEAQARIAEIVADPETYKLLGVENDPANLPYVNDSVFIVRRWRIEYIDDDWDYLRNSEAEEFADDERELAAEVRLTLND